MKPLGYFFGEHVLCSVSVRLCFPEEKKEGKEGGLVPWSAFAKLLSSLCSCMLCHPQGEREREGERDSLFPNTCFIQTALFLVMLHQGCKQLERRMVLKLCPGHITSWKDITGC